MGSIHVLCAGFRASRLDYSFSPLSVANGVWEGQSVRQEPGATSASSKAYREAALLAGIASSGNRRIDNRLRLISFQRNTVSLAEFVGGWTDQ